MGSKRDALRERRGEEDGGERNERRAASISIGSETEPSLSRPVVRKNLVPRLNAIADSPLVCTLVPTDVYLYRFPPYTCGVTLLCRIHPRLSDVNSDPAATPRPCLFFRNKARQPPGLTQVDESHGQPSL